MPPKSGTPEKPERSSRGIVKTTANKISKLTRNTPKSTPNSTPMNTPKHSSSKVVKNTSANANKNAPGPDGKWPLSDGLKTMQVNEDPHTQRYLQDQQHQMRFCYTYGQPFNPTYSYPEQYMPVGQAYYYQPNTLSSIAHPIQSDPRNGPVDMLCTAFQAKIRTLEQEVSKLRREKAEIQKSKDELIKEFQKVASLVDVALGSKVERGIGRM